MTPAEKDALYLEFRARFIDDFMKRILDTPGYHALWDEMRRWRTENQMNALTAKNASTGMRLERCGGCGALPNELCLIRLVGDPCVYVGKIS